MTDPNLSKFLPPSLGTLFDVAPGADRPTSTLTVNQDDARMIDGAFAAPELCLAVEDYDKALHPRRAFEEVKLDGIRCLHIGGALYTREATPFHAASHCLPVLHDLQSAYGEPMFFDGEYVEEGGFEPTLAAFRRKVGQGVLWLFDAVPLREWKSGRPSRERLENRKEQMIDMARRVQGNQHVGMVGHNLVQADQVAPRAEELWGAGYEGLVVKDANSHYVRKRSSDWMKLKQVHTTDLVVVDVIGGVVAGRETCKALLVRGKAFKGAPPRPTRLSHGIAGQAADRLWQMRDQVRGGLVEVEHNGWTGAGNLRSPRFLRIREFA